MDAPVLNNQISPRIFKRVVVNIKKIFRCFNDTLFNFNDINGFNRGMLEGRSR